MAMTINDVIKDAIKEMRERKLVFTPDNYREVFCKIASKHGISTADCQKLKTYIEKLNDEYKSEIQKLGVKNLDELFAFLLSRLNRAKPAENARIISSFNKLCVKILQANSLLYNKFAKNLSSATLQTLSRTTDKMSIDTLSDKWGEFVANFDDSFWKKLQNFNIDKPDDMANFVDKISEILANLQKDDTNYEEVANLVALSLLPSIADAKNTDIAILSNNIKSNPKSIFLPAVINNVKNGTKIRINLDMNEINSKASVLNSILDNIHSKLINLGNLSQTRLVKVKDIKQNLGSIDLKNSSFESIKDRLSAIANALYIENEELQNQANDDQKIILWLKKRVKELENKLVEATKESKEDFLTKIATRRAIDDELLRVEEMYRRYDISYCVCFFDIDDFKSINDTYGHDAGDLILSTLASIIKKNIRAADLLGRFGGEEFLLILPNVSLKDAVFTANKIRQIISEYQFIYKETKIFISVSCGVANRIEATSSDLLIKQADNRLYEAKNSGKNQVKPDL